MDNSEIVRLLVEQIVVPVLTALAVAAGGWLVSRMPGPVKDALYANVHEKDVRLLLGAMTRRAVAQVSPEVPTGQGTGDLISYVKAELPVLVNKMGLSDQALQTVAAAALTKAQAELSATPLTVQPAVAP
jgi:hypothetical protein